MHDHHTYLLGRVALFTTRRGGVEGTDRAGAGITFDGAGILCSREGLWVDPPIPIIQLQRSASLAKRLAMGHGCCEKVPAFLGGDRAGLSRLPTAVRATTSRWGIPVRSWVKRGLGTGQSEFTARRMLGTPLSGQGTCAHAASLLVRLVACGSQVERNMYSANAGGELVLREVFSACFHHIRKGCSDRFHQRHSYHHT